MTKVDDLLATWSAPPSGPESRPRYLARKVARHAYWARTEGLGRLVEEDRLDPRDRIRVAVSKARWRRAHALAPGAARAVFVVGLQRSGTNMLMRGLDEAPEVEVRNENDRALFDRYRLRSLDALRAVVTSSRHEMVLVKPLCDSQHVADFLNLPGFDEARALWVYRDPYERARSEVSKFADSNLKALRVIAGGAAGQAWQAERLPEAAVSLVRGFDLDALSPHAAAVLFWVIRNGLYFDLGLDGRDDVHLVSYDAVRADPAGEVRRMCEVVGFRYRPELSSHIETRHSHGSAPLEIDPRVRELADSMLLRLDEARRTGDPVTTDDPKDH